MHDVHGLRLDAAFSLGNCYACSFQQIANQVRKNHSANGIQQIIFQQSSDSLSLMVCPKIQSANCSLITNLSISFALRSVSVLNAGRDVIRRCSAVNLFD